MLCFFFFYPHFFFFFFSPFDYSIKAIPHNTVAGNKELGSCGSHFSPVVLTEQCVTYSRLLKLKFLTVMSEQGIGGTRKKRTCLEIIFLWPAKIFFPFFFFFFFFFDRTFTFCRSSLIKFFFFLFFFFFYTYYKIVVNVCYIFLIMG